MKEKLRKAKCVVVVNTVISIPSWCSTHLKFVRGSWFVPQEWEIVRSWKNLIMTVLLKNLFTVHILIWHTQIRSQHYLWWQDSAFMDTARRSATSALLHRCCGEEQRWIYIPIRCPWMQFEQVPPPKPKMGHCKPTHIHNPNEPMYLSPRGTRHLAMDFHCHHPIHLIVWSPHRQNGLDH